MKKNGLGIGLLILAGLILFQQQLPKTNISLWFLVLLVGTGWLFLKFLFKRRVIETFIFGTWFFVLLNDRLKLLTISVGSIVLASILACAGVILLMKPRKKPLDFLGKDRLKEHVRGQFTSKVSGGKSTAFSSSTRYVQDEAFVADGIDIAFGNASIYLDNAIMLGNQATFTIDGAFSTVTLYLPSNWQAIVEVDAFSTSVNNVSNMSGEKILLVTGDVAFSTINIYSV